MYMEIYRNIYENYPASENRDLVRYLSGRHRDNREREEYTDKTGPLGGGEDGDNLERRSKGYTRKRGSRGGQYGDKRDMRSRGYARKRGSRGAQYGDDREWISRGYTRKWEPEGAAQRQ